MRHDTIREPGSGRTWPRALVAVSIVLLLLVPAAQAQQVPTPTLDQINAVARELYCPLCNGVRLDTCELQACVQMRQVISDKLASGVPKEQIKQEFVAQYGPIVLGEPPREGLGWLIWIVPIAALVAGAVWVFITLRRWTKAPAAPESAVSTAGQPATFAGQGSDDYLAQVDADLARLE